MLDVIFSNLEYHFKSSHYDIDEQYFFTFDNSTIKEMYDNMLSHTKNITVICNLIYQMLNRNLGDIEVVIAAVGAIDYQNRKMRIDPKLFSITEKSIEQLKDKLLEKFEHDTLQNLQLRAYFGYILSSPEHEPIYSFKMI